MRMSRPLRADRHAQADLARALGDRHQHDVHDADAADEERHRRDRGEQDRRAPASDASCAASTSERLRTKKSSSWFGCSRWRWRRSSRICCSALETSAPCRTLTVIDPTLRGLRPAGRRARACAPSRSGSARRRPGPGRSCSGPCGRGAPTISCGTFRMRIVSPTGSDSPKSVRATVWPRSTTFAAPSTSAPVERPARRRPPTRARPGSPASRRGSASPSCCCRTRPARRRAAAARRPRSRRPRAASPRRRPR